MNAVMNLGEQFKSGAINETQYREGLKEYIQTITVGEEFENALIDIMVGKGEISPLIGEQLKAVEAA